MSIVNAALIRKLTSLWKCLGDSGSPPDADSSWTYRNQNWNIRKCGKRGFFLPVRIHFPPPVSIHHQTLVVTLTPFCPSPVKEQFTREWEHIVDSPDAQFASVAGQYSWKSNLWQFGLVSFVPVLLLSTSTLPIHPSAMTSLSTNLNPTDHAHSHNPPIPPNQRHPRPARREPVHWATQQLAGLAAKQKSLRDIWLASARPAIQPRVSPAAPPGRPLSVRGSRRQARVRGDQGRDRVGVEE